MSISSDFSALSFLLGEGRSVPCGTWYFIPGGLLPSRLRNKPRSVVATRISDDGTVVVLPRSASRDLGAPHDPHVGHTCEAQASHDTVRESHNIHPCHIDKRGWVDFDLPISLALADLRDRKMCFEDDESPLLDLLEEGTA